MIFYRRNRTAGPYEITPKAFVGAFLNSSYFHDARHGGWARTDRLMRLFTGTDAANGGLDSTIDLEEPDNMAAWTRARNEIQASLDRLPASVLTTCHPPVAWQPPRQGTTAGLDRARQPTPYNHTLSTATEN